MIMMRPREIPIFHRPRASFLVRKPKKTDTSRVKVSMWMTWLWNNYSFLPMEMSKTSSMRSMFMSPAVRR